MDNKMSIKKIVFLVLALVIFLLVTNPTLIPFLPEGVKASLGNIWGDLFGDIGSIFETVTVNWIILFKLIAMVLLLVLITDILRYVLEHLHPKTGKGKSGLTLAQSTLKYVSALVGFFWGLSIIGVSIGTILASVGIVTLVLGFGAESLVADVVSGVFLVFEDQFNVGDIIEVGAFRGMVEKIGIRTTSIRDVGGNVKIINNADIRNILNRSDASSFAAITVAISYSENLERVEKVLETILPAIKEKYPDVFLDVPKYAGVQSLGSSSVDLKIVAEVREESIFSAPRIMNREIKIAFDTEKIEIPFQQIVIHNGEKL